MWDWTYGTLSRFMRKVVLIVATLLLGSVLSAAERNVVFIITDDQSPILGCYGDAVAVTPHIDSLARDGVLFHRAYATTASCSASRSVVMSGLHNHRNGQYGHTHDEHKFTSFRDVDQLTLPNVLGRAGYRTAHVGKYHVAPEESFHFQHYFQANERNPVEMAEAVEAFVKADDEKPFFLYFAPGDPHRSNGYDEQFPGPHKPNLFGNLGEGAAHEGVDETVFAPEDMEVPSFLPDTPESRSELAQYYQSCSRIDSGVGRLIRSLKEADLFDKTLIVFTSDHGMAFAGAKTNVYEAALRVPFVVRDPYQKKRGIETSALISHADITPTIVDFVGELDRKRNRPKDWTSSSGVDEAPENIAPNHGYGEYASYHGKSWLALLSDPESEIHERLLASHTFHEIQMYYPMRAVWDQDYKLIWNIAYPLTYPSASDLWNSSTWQVQYKKGMDASYGQRTVGEYLNRPEFELYDMSEAEYEGRNLAEDPEFKNVLKRYSGYLKGMQLDTGDPWISKWSYE